MRRLHWQFYFAILATMALFIVASIVLWHATSSSRDDRIAIQTAAQLAEQLLPPPTASEAENQKIIGAVSAHLGTGIALFAADGSPLAQAGDLPALNRDSVLHARGWTLTSGGPVWIIPLEDGRRLAFQPAHHLRPHGPQLLGLSIAAVIAFALGAYPIARRLTGRLEKLQSGVERLGVGDMAARVEVRGNDEVAALARSFNAAAERIAALMQSQKTLLANCSHELRTPLARIGLAIECLSDEKHAAVRSEVKRNVAELDELIDQVLLASRLDSAAPLHKTEDVDLLALAAEEAAHYNLEAEGEPVIVRADPSLLRRLIRNLLDNAQRHAGGASRVHVSKDAAGRALLVVEDRGPGIDPGERAELFTPFHSSRAKTAAGRGYGLGLSIVRQVARAHGGEVEYSAFEEGGSRFTVRLPL
ncbi:MAG TPA: ATP-binding protein [Steroidobacteraceae bacterium]|nr:ATP-binding protein [Steroidobacteraceae bacterium]